MSCKKKIAGYVLLCILLCVGFISGCSDTNKPEDTQDTKTENIVKSNNVSYDDNDYYSDYTSETYETINLDDESGSVNITKKGTYVLTGSLKNGSVIVDANDAVVRIVLKNASIHCEKSAPIYVKKAKKVIVSLPEGTKNTISDGSSYSVNSDEEPSAALFSKSDLTVNGIGSLSVQATYKNAIQSKDTLKLMDGTYELVSANDAIKGKDYVYIHAGTYTIQSDGDGIVTTNTKEKGELIIENGTFNITTKQDGIQSVSSILIYDGKFNVKSGGGSVNAVTGESQPFGEFGDYDETSEKSMKGIKAETSIEIQKGTFAISSKDDAIHANDTVEIKGGTLSLSSDDDGIHGDYALTITGGSIDVLQSYEGLEAGTITISDGTIHVLSSDDGINAASDTGTPLLSITGGYVYVDAYGDGVDSNQDITMSGGTLIVMGPTSGGNGALDYDGTFNMNGGTLIAAGSSGMAMAPSTTSKQASIMVNLDASASKATPLYISDEDGNSILGTSPSKSYQSVVFSSPDIKTGSTYQVMQGGTASNVKDSLFTSATNGTNVTTLKISDVIATYGSGGMQNPGQGGPGGGGGMRP